MDKISVPQLWAGQPVSRAFLTPACQIVRPLRIATPWGAGMGRSAPGAIPVKIRPWKDLQDDLLPLLLSELWRGLDAVEKLVTSGTASHSCLIAAPDGASVSIDDRADRDR